MIEFIKENYPGTVSVSPIFFEPDGRLCTLNFDSIKSEKELHQIIKKKGLLQSVKVKDDNNPENINEINNYIDHVISVYHKNPWKMKIPSDVIYNNLLPYKILNEDFTGWYPFYSKYFSFLENKIPSQKLKRNEIDSIIWNNVKTHDSLDLFGGGLNAMRLTLWPGIKEIKTIKSGDCQSISTLMVYLYRYLGIPARIDFTPHWGGVNSGHALPVAWDSDLQKFTPIKGDIFEEKNKLAKAFRISFKRTGEWSENIAPFLQNKLTFPIESLKNDHWEDATRSHIPTSNIMVNIPGFNGTIAYICVYNYGKWKPVYYAKKENNGKFIFKNMGRNIIYRYGYFNKNETLTLSDKVIHLQKEGIIKILNDIPDTQSQILPVQHIDKINTGSEAWVKKGHSYTLNYLDRSGNWSPIQTVSATKDALVTFRNIPKKELYILQDNTSKRNLERPFRLENHNIIWY
ncbi:transglutaminase domain-containing protein [Elizabethkingia meningoseptica]|uniref:transglutaminase domain-containing protein n=1 Tax=Elizabethkingia meningoseptica TaxID=238 RepID=UPI0038917866